MNKTSVQELTTFIVSSDNNKNTKAVPQLIQSLYHENANVRRLAASAIGKIGSPEAELPLIGILFDEKPQVRQYAIKALGEIGTTLSLPPLQSIIEDVNEKYYNKESSEIAIKRITLRNKSQIKKPDSQSPVNIVSKPVNITLSFPNFQLSQDQKTVLQNLFEWYKKQLSSYITVGGYAGTGKTTLIALLRLMLSKNYPKLRVAFACFTGKASQVLKLKLLQHNAFFSHDFSGTIHMLMYHPVLDKHGKIIGWRRNKSIPYDLVIVDEASMVTEDIWNDLTSYQKPLVAVGDHGQLPPIDGNFNLMDKPQLRLEIIHRHSQGNPIITVATHARLDGSIPIKQFGDRVVKYSKNSEEARLLVEEIFSSKDNQTLVLCGRNRTRVSLNRQIRQLLNISSDEPLPGETVICLKNNYTNPDGPIYNGMLGILEVIAPHESHWYQADILFPDEERRYHGQISKHQFFKERFLEHVPGINYRDIGDRFDFGYALTVHKAQGSQAKRVLLFEEPSSHWHGELWNRWLYTAVTRAVEELYIIGM